MTHFEIEPDDPILKNTEFVVDDGYESGSPINVVGRMLEATIDEVFNTPDHFPCTIIVPAGILGETETINMRLDPPRTKAPTLAPTSTAAPSTLAPSTAVPSTLAPTTPAPTPAPLVTISGVVYVKIVFPSRSSPLDESDINEVGAAVCHHIARYLSWVYRPQDVEVPECTWDVRAQLHNQIRLIFHYTAVISGFDYTSRTAATRNSNLEIGNVVEESFVDAQVRDDLINDLHNLSDANPLSETTSVELDTDTSSAEAPTEQPVSCSLVPEFLQSIPFLGALLNTVMCFLFGPEGMLANLTGLFV